MVVDVIGWEKRGAMSIVSFRLLQAQSASAGAKTEFAGRRTWDCENCGGTVIALIVGECTYDMCVSCWHIDQLFPIFEE